MHILALPKWYPNEEDVQLGSFIQKQFEAISDPARVSLVFISPTARPGLCVDEGTTNGVWVLRGGYRPVNEGPAAMRRVLNFLRYWHTMMKAITHVRNKRGLPDLTHVHVLTAPAMVARWISMKWGLPYLVTEHNSGFITGKWDAQPAAAKAIDRWLMRGAAKVTVVGPLLAEALQRNGLAKDPIVVPNIVPGLDSPLPPAGSATDFLMVADLVDHIKNISGVLRAFAKIGSARPEWHLSIIGGGPDDRALRILSENLGLQEQVTWLGRMENKAVLGHMAKCGTVIVNSNVETFSIVTGEALAMGKPVIATRCGGPEALIHEGNGLLIPPKDEPALAAAMLGMASRHGEFPPQEQRDSLGSSFTATAVGEQYLSVYRSILGHG